MAQLSNMYAADPSYTYQVGGYSGDAWTYTYTRTLSSIFSGDAEFDTSILISGNLDCDIFKSINNTRYEWMMFADDSAPSNPNFRRMMIDPLFGEYEQAKLLGTCLLQSTNWASFSVFNLTQMTSIIGADMSGARFCLGNKTSGFQKLTLFPTSMSVEKQPPEKATSGGTRYSSINYTTITTLEDIQDRTLKSAGFDFKHTERELVNVTQYTFSSDYRPILTFVIQYNDDILLVNAAYLINKGDGGYVNNYKRGIPVSHAFGKILERPNWINMNTEVTTPQWITRPNLGDREDNDLGMYCEVYTSRSYWYIYTHMLYNGSIVRRLLTISGLFFLWDSAYAASGYTTQTFNENLCLGSRDEYGQIKQDEYNKGWASIVENDDYYDKLDYNKLPVVNPNPPSGDGDDDDVEKMEIGGWYTAGGMVNYYAISEKSTLDDLSECLSSWDYVATGKDVLRNLISLKAFPIEHEKLCRGQLKQIEIAGVKAVKRDESMVETPIKANTVDSTYASINFGSIDIPAKFGDFRDYAPYTKIEIFIPFCGWVGLPSHCMNHNVKVELTYDIITGTCKAFVMLDGNTIVAEICGVMSFDIPFTADAAGMKAASVTSGVLGTASGALGTIGSLGLGAGFSALNFASSSVGLANSVSQLVIANNANYTEVRGNTGDSNNFAGPKTCFLKISRPISNIPDNYPRAVGWMYNKAATLESGMGFTTIDNPIIHGSMTKAEKSSIQSLLINGVIL